MGRYRVTSVATGTLLRTHCLSPSFAAEGHAEVAEWRSRLQFRDRSRKPCNASLLQRRLTLQLTARYRGGERSLSIPPRFVARENAVAIVERALITEVVEHRRVTRIRRSRNSAPTFVRSLMLQVKRVTKPKRGSRTVITQYTSGLINERAYFSAHCNHPLAPCYVCAVRSCLSPACVIPIGISSKCRRWRDFPGIERRLYYSTAPPCFVSALGRGAKCQRRDELITTSQWQLKRGRWLVHVYRVCCRA